MYFTDSRYLSTEPLVWPLASRVWLVHYFIFVLNDAITAYFGTFDPRYITADLLRRYEPTDYTRLPEPAPNVFVLPITHLLNHSLPDMNAPITPITLPAKNPESTFQAMRIGHIGLRTTSDDFAGLIDWYVENLDFRLIRQVDLGHVQLAFLTPANDDACWLEIVCARSTEEQQGAAPASATGYQHFCLDVMNVDETLATLNKRGIPTVRGPFDIAPIGKRCGFIADPLGNSIEFAQNIG